jgi:YHS domain-containing protein
VKEQPGAAVGDRVYCAVSGAVFTVTAESPRRDHDGKALYFCCPGCATHFDAHAAQVAARRGY